MRCKKHPADLSSGVGVCATCLRERLFAIIAAQAQSQAPKQAQKDLPPPPPPPPLSFPRSVSPYISRRKSDTAAAWRTQSRHHRFFSTPQVGPAGSTAVEIDKDERGRRRTKSGRFLSLFLGIFRSKSERPDSGPGPNSDPGVSVESCSVSTTPWFYPSFIAGRRKIKDRSLSTDESKNGSQQRRICYKNRDRGMSPARCPEDEDDGGYSSESSHVRRPTPRSTPSQGRRGVGKAATPSRNVSGLIICLSPLVRASPNRQRNPKGVAPEMGAAGESRVPAKPCISAAASFCKNRSRKLADFGRYN